MALELNHEMATGVSGNYWRITSLHMNRSERTVSVQICLYLDESAREAGKEPLCSRVKLFTGNDYTDFEAESQDEDGVNAVKTAYEKLKESEEFLEAEDV